ncbi:3-oxoacyl-[acyl-carrier protein] reductase [Raineyella antarctica]|uniref:3-oxoacyl-[acyl-carrier protein] reductase n=1 Tax=Raineyella antarctica TaxID=1577474 RepID=A0A1G6GCU9_9ACTN|nr:SDR family oxidoreductase [Raineyella antarctica]SDB79811.1 3-oxoacyl-[acyl-carrier protein] reductase [Raineyella antarctica]
MSATTQTRTDLDPRTDRDPRVILVVGGAAGIGKAVAGALEARGDIVAVLDRNPAEGEQPSGGHHVVDVRDQDSIEATIKAVVETHGGIDGLVYAAGALDGYATLEEITPQVLDTVFAVNTFGALRVVQAVVPAMKERGQGRIVLFGSIAGSVAGAGGIAYTMSKHAVEGLVRHLAVELGPAGITTNCLAPGSITGTNIRTSITQMLPTQGIATNRGLGTSDPETAAKLYPVGRLGTVDAVVPSVLHLLEDSSWFINGTTVTIDGGYICR